MVKRWATHAGHPRHRKGRLRTELVSQFQLGRMTFGPVYQIQFGPTQALEGLRDQPLGSHFDRLMHRFAKVARSWGSAHLLKQFPAELLTAHVVR